MRISYPTHHRWFRENSTDPLASFGARNRKKVLASLPKLDACNITWSIEPLSESFFTWFTPLYETTILNKANPEVHAIYEKTLGKPVQTYPYFSLTVSENGEHVGGTIFSVRPDRLVYAFRAFHRTWDVAQISANPAILGEYAVSQYASEQPNLRNISHGRDRNPYGLNSEIGLAAFKLSVGCYPLLTDTVEVMEFETDTLSSDALILEYPETGTRITKAYLITDPLNEEKYLQVTKYPDLLPVEVIHRKV